MLKIVFPLLLASASAFAETAAVTYGAPNCRIGNLLPAPTDNDDVTWSGACKDGYAEGPGTLAWNDADDGQRRLEGTLAKGVVAGEAKLTWASRKSPRGGTGERNSYEGTFRDGRPDGQGFIQYAGGSMYEGGVVAGKEHGAGIYLGVDRSRYEGQWVDGKRHGQGKATFAVGGSYDGAWKNGEFDGVGTVVYAGTPRTWHGNFVEGRPADLAKPVIAEDGTYNIPGDYMQSGSRTRAVISTVTIPPRASWTQLSVAEQNSFKNRYAALAPGDEPPYPVQGMQATIKLIAHIQGNFDYRGSAYILTTVGADGKARSATIAGKVPADLARYLSAAALTQVYKPAVCAGTPCEMIYPMYLSLQ